MAATRRQRWRPQLRPLQQMFIFWGNISRPTDSDGGFPNSYLFCDYEKDIIYYDCEPSDGLRQQF